MGWRYVAWGGLGLALACILVPTPVCARQSGGDSGVGQDRLLLYLLAWLLPLGVALVAVGVSEPARAARVAGSLPLAFSISLICYYICGFTFQYGGVGLVATDPGLSSLVSEWSPMGLGRGSGWGLLGMGRPVFVVQSASEVAMRLFVAELPLLTTATLIPLMTLSGQIPRLPTLLLTLFVPLLCYPMVGNWVHGGGWLAHVGLTLHLGRGYVDYGFSWLHLVGGAVALAGLAAFKRRPAAGVSHPELQLPPGYLPLNVLIGAFLALVGWLANIYSHPLVAAPDSQVRLMLNILVAVGCGSAATLFYGWLVRGTFDAGLAGRGIIAALVAVGAGSPSYAPWIAGLVAGVYALLLAPLMYVVERFLRLDDHGAAIAAHGGAALWGILAVALLSDGGLAASPFRPELRSLGQLYAQLVGVGAIGLLACLLPWGAMTLVAQGYAVPARVLERARELAARRQEERRSRELQKRRGERRTLGQTIYAAYLAGTTRAQLRLRRWARAVHRAPRQASLRAIVRTARGGGQWPR